MTVLELMKVHVTRILPDATVREAVDVFDLYQVTALPVTDVEGRILGMVYEPDLARLILNDLKSWERIGSTPVREVMISPAVTVDEQAPASRALSLMTEAELHWLPVTSEARLSGGISRNDICQAVLDGASIV